MTVSDEAIEAAASNAAEVYETLRSYGASAPEAILAALDEFKAAPHMLSAPEGVSEAEKEAAALVEPHIVGAKHVRIRVVTLRRVLSALSSERERAKRAERERDEARGVVRDTLWMARRYADGRQSYAVGMYNDAAKIAEAGGYAKGEPDGTLYALDGLRPEYQALEARAQAAEAKVKELEAPFDWTAEDLVDLMAEAIMDAIDMDTNATDYARAALEALNKEGLLRSNDSLGPNQ